MCINEIRKIKYANYDGNMIVLTESLKMIRGLEYYENESYTLLNLPRSIIQPYIHYGEVFSFK